MRKIVLLFLAHEGLTKEAVEFWAKWNTWTGHSLILFCNIGPAIEGKHADMWTHMGNPPTKYCDASLVLVVQESIQKILGSDTKKQIQGLYLLSAMDYPLVTAEELYTLPDLNRFCSLTTASAPAEERKILPSNSFPHTQWFSLNRAGMEAFAKYDFRQAAEYHRKLAKSISYAQQLKELKMIMNDLQQGYLSVVMAVGPTNPNAQGWNFALKEVQRRFQRLEKEKKESLSDIHSFTEKCPDEYWSLFPILAAKLPVSPYCTTASYQPVLLTPDGKRFPGNIGSPITWDKKSHYLLNILQQPKNEGAPKNFPSLTFADIVDHFGKLKRTKDPFIENSFLFLRKVDPQAFSSS